MDLLRGVGQFFKRLRHYVGRDEFDRELDEEMQFHLDLKTEELIEAGMSPEDARYAARKSFGGTLATRERCRDVRGIPVLEELWQDVRFGLRTLRKNPGFTAVAVVTLGLGVGANTAIFSVTNAVLLRPLPYPDPERLVHVSQKTPQLPRAGFSVADLVDVARQSRSFERFGGFAYEAINFGSPNGTDWLPMGYVTAGFFDAVGVQPALGRGFDEEHDRPGAPQIAVVSHEVWRDRLGADPNVVGRSVTLDGRPFEIVGVMPARFQLYEKVDIWIPMGLWPYSRERDNHFALFGVGRLGPGVTLEAAQAEADAIAANLSREYPKSNVDRGLSLVSLREDLVGSVRESLRLLTVAVGFVLLIACANVAHLLLARGAVRRKEIAIRTAIGAGRLRIVRQLLTESLLLALAGGAFGVLLAFWVSDLVIGIGGAGIPRSAELGAERVDLGVLAFSLVVSLLAGLVFGIAPAVQAAAPSLVDALKQDGRGAGVARGRLRDALVVGEIALAVVLLVGAGLLVKSILLLRGESIGYDANHVLAVGLSFPRSTYDDDADRGRFATLALERIRSLPGVEQAAFSYPLPVYGRAWGMSYSVAGEPPPQAGQAPPCQTASVSPGFFSALKIPLLEGREFDDGERPDSAPVVIVDETIARRHWPDESAVGKLLTVTGDKPRTIVGVVGAVRNWGLGEAPRPQIYLPSLQQLETGSFVPFGYISVRTAVEPSSVADAVRSKLGEVDLDVAAFESRTMDDLLDQSVSRQWFSTLLMQLFAGLALVLAAVGVYGVMAYAVAQRTREIGVRIALGASRKDVLRLVIGEGTRLALAGVAVGTAASLVLNRLISGLLYGVSSTDPAVYLSVAIVLVGVALGACLVPALRATRVDPLVALRSE